MDNVFRWNLNQPWQKQQLPSGVGRASLKFHIFLLIFSQSSPPGGTCATSYEIHFGLISFTGGYVDMSLKAPSLTFGHKNPPAQLCRAMISHANSFQVTHLKGENHVQRADKKNRRRKWIQCGWVIGGDVTASSGQISTDEIHTRSAFFVRRSTAKSVHCQGLFELRRWNIRFDTLELTWRLNLVIGWFWVEFSFEFHAGPGGFGRFKTVG